LDPRLVAFTPFSPWSRPLMLYAPGDAGLPIIENGIAIILHNNNNIY